MQTKPFEILSPGHPLYCLSLLHPCPLLLNPFTPEGFLIDELDHLALDRVKPIGVSGTYGSEKVKGDGMDPWLEE